MNYNQEIKMTGIYICPICKKSLSINGNSYVCQNTHTFDISKDGYVNLAFCLKGVKPDSGDSDKMCYDRRRFLEQGFYAPAANVLCELIEKLSENSPQARGKKVIIDAGCGEGYYLRTMRDRLGDSFSYFGVDLAKEGVRLASKSEKKQSDEKINYAVAGIFELPFRNECADFCTSVFAPVCSEEFQRVLKPGGYLAVLGPGEKHLFGLKEKIYDTPRENIEKIPEYDGFILCDTKRVTYNIDVSKQFIPALFGMTPYYWKSSEKTQNTVNSLEGLSTLCDFLIKIYKKA